jgi:hypothetical protein
VLRVERFGFTYGTGDKVMQVENDYDRFIPVRAALPPP